MKEDVATEIFKMRLSSELKEKLEAESIKLKRSASDVVRGLVEAYFGGAAKVVGQSVDSPVVRGMKAMTRDGGPVSGDKPGDPPKPSMGIAEAYREVVLPRLVGEGVGDLVATGPFVCDDCGQEIVGTHAVRLWGDKTYRYCQACDGKRVEGK